MRKRYLEVNITTQEVRVDGAPLPSSGLKVVHGDTELLCVSFFESIPEDISGSTAESRVDLTEGGAPLGLRYTLDSARLEAATLLTFQDSYNQGLWSQESLADGRVSWLVDFGAAAVTSALGSEESITTPFSEFSFLGADNYPQTLVQFRTQVVAQLDSGAAGSPPPSSPTHQTAADALTDYALAPTRASVITTSQTLTTQKRQVTYPVDLSSGNVTLTIPAVSGVDDEWRPVIQIVATGNTLTVQRSSTDTLNAVTSFTGTSLFSEYRLIPDKTNSRYIIPDFATP